MMKKMTRAGTSLCLLLMAAVFTGPALAGQDPAQAASIETRLTQLEDREAILQLLVTYGHLLDEKDLRGYSQLFAADGVWEGGIGSATGPQGIYDMLDTVFKRVPPGNYGNDYHIMSDFQVTTNGDTATSRSNWTWVVEGSSGTPVIQRSGHYEDQLVKVDGVWKFKHRLTVTEMPTPEKDSEAQIFRKDHRDTE
jgi:hypothetical protein